MKSILNYIEVGKKEAASLPGAAWPKTRRRLLHPATVIADIAPTARLAQEEIFGPVLAVIKARNFDDALAIANNTGSALPAVYSTSREKWSALAPNST